MGQLNRPTVVKKSTSGPRKSETRVATAAKACPPGDAKTGNMDPTDNNRPAKILLPAVQSEYTRMAPGRRATVSFGLTANRGRAHTVETAHVSSRSPSSPPPARASTAPSFIQSSPRSISSLLRGRNPQHAVQDRYPSILECLYNHKGDAQVSPSREQDSTDVSPIDAAARHVQERGRSARAEALQIVGTLLKRVFQQKIEKEEIRNVFFMTCIDIFAREPLDNVAEVAFAFQLLCVLFQEDILQGSDFVKAAAMLAEEGHHDSCKLLVQLILIDDKLKIAPSEVETLTDIASNLELDRSKGKEKA